MLVGVSLKNITRKNDDGIYLFFRYIYFTVSFVLLTAQTSQTLSLLLRKIGSIYTHTLGFHVPVLR